MLFLCGHASSCSTWHVWPIQVSSQIATRIIIKTCSQVSIRFAQHVPAEALPAEERGELLRCGRERLIHVGSKHTEMPKAREGYISSALPITPHDEYPPATPSMICVMGRGPLSHNQVSAGDIGRVVNSIYLLDQVCPHLIRASGEDTMSGDCGHDWSQLEYNLKSSTHQGPFKGPYHNKLSELQVFLSWIQIYKFINLILDTKQIKPLLSINFSY